jgi:hypothetical protein
MRCFLSWRICSEVTVDFLLGRQALEDSTLSELRGKNWSWLQETRDERGKRRRACRCFSHIPAYPGEHRARRIIAVRLFVENVQPVITDKKQPAVGLESLRRAVSAIMGVVQRVFSWNSHNQDRPFDRLMSSWLPITELSVDPLFILVLHVFYYATRRVAHHELCRFNSKTSLASFGSHSANWLII